jgi:hypothetical protein
MAISGVLALAKHSFRYHSKVRLVLSDAAFTRWEG